MTLRDVAAELEVSPATVSKLCTHHKIRHQRIKGAIHIEPEAVAEYLLACEVAPIDADTDARRKAPRRIRGLPVPRYIEKLKRAQQEREQEQANQRARQEWERRERERARQERAQYERPAKALRPRDSVAPTFEGCPNSFDLRRLRERLEGQGRKDG